MPGRGQAPQCDRKFSRGQVERQFRSSYYRRHNQRRQEHLASLSLNLHNKRVLEIGAGVGDHTSFFTDRGCSVVALEPRPENCRLFRQTMTELGIKSPAIVRLLQLSVDQAQDMVRETFDIVYAYGVLYHLADPAAGLRFMSERCSGILLLETRVSFGSDCSINSVAERGPSEAIGEVGCRPTRDWIWMQLASLFEHVYVTATQPSHPEFPLDWEAPWPAKRPCRSIFVAARAAIDSRFLLSSLPQRQTR